MVENNNCTCGNFIKILGSFEWFSLIENENIKVVPIIKGTMLRVNHCPVCGGDVRNIHISSDELKESVTYVKN
jgi:hypothetical protein